MKSILVLIMMLMFGACVVSDSPAAGESRIETSIDDRGQALVDRLEQALLDGIDTNVTICIEANQGPVCCSSDGQHMCCATLGAMLCKPVPSGPNNPPQTPVAPTTDDPPPAALAAQAAVAVGAVDVALDSGPVAIPAELVLTPNTTTCSTILNEERVCCTSSSSVICCCQFNRCQCQNIPTTPPNPSTP